MTLTTFSVGLSFSVGPSVCWSVGPSVYWSVWSLVRQSHFTFLGFYDLWPHCSCPNDGVASNTAPAHPHATWVAVYRALLPHSNSRHYWYRQLKLIMTFCLLALTFPSCTLAMVWDVSNNLFDAYNFSQLFLRSVSWWNGSIPEWSRQEASSKCSLWLLGYVSFHHKCVLPLIHEYFGFTDDWCQFPSSRRYRLQSMFS